MKKLHLLPVVVICCLSLSCSKEAPDAGIPSGPDNRYLPAPPQTYPGFKVDNYFGLKLYQAIFEKTPFDNLCVSPFSVRTALSMVANGTAGGSLGEILKALHISDTTLQALDESYLNLANYLKTKDPTVAYEAANSFWYQEGLTVRPDCRNDLLTYFDAEVFPVDFGAPGTLGLMNAWVSEKTHGKITEIASSIPPNTLMNLTNAIYFNGEWTWKFDRKGTKPWAFDKLDRTRSEIAVMSNSKKYRYYEHPSWYGIEMPYGNGDWAMYIFMPHHINCLDNLTNWLVNNWETVRKEFIADQDILIRLPQFEIENDFDLKPFLKDLGINQIFEGNANFSRMMESPVTIGKASHKTYIKVNEDGTEAAAITSFWGIGGGPPGLFFDHPFLYLIAERTTGLILFIGQVTDPAKKNLRYSCLLLNHFLSLPRTLKARTWKPRYLPKNFSATL